MALIGRAAQPPRSLGVVFGDAKAQVDAYASSIVDVQLLGNRSFRHDGAGLAAMAEWILARTGAVAAAIGVAIEIPHGPVVEAMMERGFAVHSLNPKQLDRFRDRLSPAGAKDDMPVLFEASATVSSPSPAPC